MNHAVWSRSVGLLLLGACTPLGLWLYDDPLVTVSRITLQVGEGRAGSSPVIVALAVRNRNDYPLSAERMELSMQVDGVPIGQVQHDSPVPVAMDTISTVALRLSLEQGTTREHLKSLSGGIHIFAVRGRAIFRTPIGVRKVRFTRKALWSLGSGTTAHRGNLTRARSSRSR